MPAPHFHRIIAVDWSARSGLAPVRPSRDCLWAATARVGAAAEPEATYFRSRLDIARFLQEHIAEAAAAGERVLIGFDFAFGYPAGTLAALGVEGGWRGLLGLMAGLMQDDGAENTRFAVADRLNARLGGGPGPLWGHPNGRRFEHLAARRGVFPHLTADGRPLPEFRRVDLPLRGKGLQSVWKICYTASVGGQTLTGLPWLHRLLEDPRVVAWPFDTGFTADPFAVRPGTVAVLAEIWPGLRPIDRRWAGGIRDEGQVKTVADALRTAADRGETADLFAPPAVLANPTLAALAAGEEGWILGAPYPAEAPAAAAAQAPRSQA